MSLQTDVHNPPTDDASLLILLVDASAAFWDERYGAGPKALGLRTFFEQASQTLSHLVVMVNILIESMNCLLVASVLGFLRLGTQRGRPESQSSECGRFTK